MVWGAMNPLSLLQRANGLAKRALLHSVKLATSPGYREAQRLSRSGRPGLFQPENSTRWDRYPDLFDWLKRRFSNAVTPSILSFGCSTGEEIETIKFYLPTARIVGTDINAGNLREAARKTKRFGDSVYLTDVATSLQYKNGFDAVLCLTVLLDRRLRIEGRTECSDFITFAQFEETATALAKCVKLGGLLVIYGCNFRFSDTAISSDFDTNTGFQPEDRGTPVFGRDNRLLPGVHNTDAVFRRRS